MIRLTLKAEPPLRNAADMLVPELVATLSTSEIERLPLMLGNRRSQMAEWFRVEATADDSVEIVGPCRRIDRIGAGMTQGRISVRGDAGDGLAGALPGAVGGMSGGIVILGGNAGAFVGQRLRRGLVVTGGGVGAACGSGMIAGTIVIGGRVGADLGIAMRRGSILALGGAERLGPTFVDCGVHDLVWLRLLRRHVAALGEPGLAERIQSLRRYAGDAAVAGRGELLVPP